MDQTRPSVTPDIAGLFRVRPDAQQSPVKGRFAPSPTGRMHLGNVYAALLSWLSARAKGGTWLLRIEDLDPGRSRHGYARLIEDDLDWLGLDWDEGGLDDRGPAGPYSQSRRGDLYEAACRTLGEMGLTYPCTCTRADIMASQAPHQSDGRVVYGGRCRPAEMPSHPPVSVPEGRHALRVWVPEGTVTVDDMVYGKQSFSPARECGDFVIRRTDGAWAYQLAVVVDDALMGVTEVVRGEDLLLSAAQQTMLFGWLGYGTPAFGHLPLLCNGEGQRLSKRDGALAMDALRRSCRPEDIIGRVARLAGLVPEEIPMSARELLGHVRSEWMS